LRPGRFDFLLEVSKPDEKSRFAIWRIHTKGKPVAANVDLKELTKLSEGLTGSDIEAVATKAALSAIRASINEKKTKINITKKHFQDALRECTASKS